MRWCAPSGGGPNPRDFYVIRDDGRLRVELRSGGALQAVRTFAWGELGEALALGERWRVLGPSIFILERPKV